MLTQMRKTNTRISSALAEPSDDLVDDRAGLCTHAVLFVLFFNREFLAKAGAIRCRLSRTKNASE